MPPRTTIADGGSGSVAESKGAYWRSRDAIIQLETGITETTKSAPPDTAATKRNRLPPGRQKSAMDVLATKRMTRKVDGRASSDNNFRATYIRSMFWSQHAGAYVSAEQCS